MGILLALALSTFVHADFCASDTARSLLAPYLNSKEKIEERCVANRKARHDRTRENKSQCQETWKALNACAEKYLSDKASVCGEMAARTAGAGAQTEQFDAAQGRFADGASAQHGLAAELEVCAAAAKKRAKAQESAIAQYRKDGDAIRRAAQRDPASLQRRTARE